MPGRKYGDSPKDLGSGTASKAASALKDRKAAVDAAIRKGSGKKASTAKNSFTKKKTNSAKKSSAIYKTGKASFSQSGSPGQRISKNSATRHNYK